MSYIKYKVRVILLKYILSTNNELKLYLIAHRYSTEINIYFSRKV